MNWRYLYSYQQKIKKANLLEEYQDIAQMTYFDFVKDTKWCLILGLFHGFSIPRASRIMCGTKEFKRYPQKRLDDTLFLLASIFKHGVKSRTGLPAALKIVEAHRNFNISNADMLYVLVLDLYGLIKWTENFGWRKLSHKEQTAWMWQWYQLGEFMGIQGMTDDPELMQQFIKDYEANHQYYDPANKELTDILLDTICSNYFRPLRPFLRKGILSLLGPKVCQCLGQKMPSTFWVKSTYAALRCRALTLKLRPFLKYKQEALPSYPKGVNFDEVGPSFCPRSASTQTAKDKLARGISHGI